MFFRFCFCLCFFQVVCVVLFWSRLANARIETDKTKINKLTGLKRKFCFIVEWIYAMLGLRYFLSRQAKIDTPHMLTEFSEQRICQFPVLQCCFDVKLLMSIHVLQYTSNRCTCLRLVVWIITERRLLWFSFFSNKYARISEGVFLKVEGNEKKCHNLKVAPLFFQAHMSMTNFGSHLFRFLKR